MKCIRHGRYDEREQLEHVMYFTKGQLLDICLAVKTVPFSI